MFEMTNSNKSVFIDRNTSHIKHGWQEKRIIMEYNACVSCALIGHNFPTVLQVYIIAVMIGQYEMCACITLISWITSQWLRQQFLYTHVDIWLVFVKMIRARKFHRLTFRLYPVIHCLYHLSAEACYWSVFLKLVETPM